MYISVFPVHGDGLKENLMATEFRDAVLDRTHVVAKKLADVTRPDNPTRSPSTSHTVVDEIKAPICELEILCVLLEKLT